MGLNRVSNPAKLRKLSARVGKTIVRGYARFFEPQTTVLAFAEDGTAYAVPKVGEVEPYPGVQMVENGVRSL